MLGSISKLVLDYKPWATECNPSENISSPHKSWWTSRESNPGLQILTYKRLRNIASCSILAWLTTACKGLPRACSYIFVTVASRSGSYPMNWDGAKRCIGKPFRLRIRPLGADRRLNRWQLYAAWRVLRLALQSRLRDL